MVGKVRRHNRGFFLNVSNNLIFQHKTLRSEDEHGEMRGEEGALGFAGSHGQGFIIKASWERHRKASEKGKDKEILWNKNLVKVERRKERKDRREGGQEGGKEEERRKGRRKRKKRTSLASHLRGKAQTAELANQASWGHRACAPLPALAPLLTWLPAHGFWLVLESNRHIPTSSGPLRSFFSLLPSLLPHLLHARAERHPLIRSYLTAPHLKSNIQTLSLPVFYFSPQHSTSNTWYTLLIYFIYFLVPLLEYKCENIRFCPFCSLPYPGAWDSAQYILGAQCIQPSLGIQGVDTGPKSVDAQVRYIKCHNICT